jgi:hypothetical protein
MLRRSRVITADLKACRHPRNEVINPAAPGRIFMILPVLASPEERAVHCYSLLQVILNSNKAEQRTRWMAAVDDSFATRRSSWRTQPAKKVDPPGGTTGRVGCDTGVDEAPVPNAGSTEAFSSEVANRFA